MIETSVYVRYYDLEDYNRSTVRVGVQHDAGKWVAKYFSPRKCRAVETVSEETFSDFELEEFVIENEKVPNAYVLYEHPDDALASVEPIEYPIRIYRLSHEMDGVLYETFGGMRDACELMADYLANVRDDYIEYVSSEVWDAVFNADTAASKDLGIVVEMREFGSDDGMIDRFPFVRCSDDAVHSRVRCFL